MNANLFLNFSTEIRSINFPKYSLANELVITLTPSKSKIILSIWSMSNKTSSRSLAAKSLVPKLEPISENLIVFVFSVTISTMQM